ncbi:MAG: hypothetical protein EAZ90_06530 [Oscillatoriales cyanobacterium]|nr:MAG: hypothetical protein EAZ94_22520 [Oscillatoriales cyanobacterium]TAE20002.1 MAG: hypothetical protein EAZ93_25575 [Oscillatoriales cyanobacterium]TAE44393.1 MAG: hypothetical protein EAZ90_06530 [Oscillatoriales cyanobacterium]
MLFVSCYLLVVICWLLFVGCYLLFVSCYLLVVSCYLLVVSFNGSISVLHLQCELKSSHYHKQCFLQN